MTRPKAPSGGDLDLGSRPRRSLESPLLEALSRRTLAIELRGVAPPSLESLRVEVAGPARITEAEVLEQLRRLLLRRAAQKDRAPGEPVGVDDEVLVSTVGYSHRRLVPRSVLHRVWLGGVHPAFPGLREQLTGAPVGTAVELGVCLRPDFTQEAFRGASALFRVEVLAARELLVADLEDPRQLAELGAGSSLEAVMERAGQAALEEARARAELRAQDAVLDLLASRVQVAITRSHVDQEIKKRWAEMEGRTLAQWLFTDEEQTEALAAWLEDPSERATAERRLRSSIALSLVGEAAGLSPAPEAGTALVQSLARMAELTETEVRQAIADGRDVSLHFQQLNRHLAVVDHVMSHAEIVWQSPE